MEEGVRCSGLSAVIGELWGDPAALDFTATRRLAVAAERSRVPCWLVRLGGTANLSGARMRWRIASGAALAHPFDPRAPGASGLGGRAVPRTRHPPGRWSIAHEADASIWLPHLAMERWAKSSDFAPDAPVVLTVEGTHGPIIHAVTPGRRRTRRTAGRPADRCPRARPGSGRGSCRSGRRCGAGGAAGALGRALVAAGRGRRRDALRLDVTGVAHLFGGERKLVADVQARFAGLGLTARVAIAPTAAAAWALAHYGHSARGDRSARKDEHRLRSLARTLPVAALRLPPEATVRTLERLGLKTIGALAGMPRLALARRFREADNPVDALDRALGRKPEPLTAAPTEPPPRALLQLEEPATHPEAAGQALERLIPDLVRQLQQRHLGARRLSLTGFRVDGSTAVASVATAIPSREPKHLQRLLADKAAALDPGFGFDAFALEAELGREPGAAQDSLVEEPSGEREVARLVDRLTSSSGPSEVRRPQATKAICPSGRAGGCGRSAARSVRARSARRTAHQLALLSARQRLLDRPEAIAVIYATPEGVPRRFVWRRAVHDIARVEGPERIAPEWWRERSTARLRDYYRVEDQAGRRYWIYREGLIGDGRGGAARLVSSTACSDDARESLAILRFRG